MGYCLTARAMETELAKYQARFDALLFHGGRVNINSDIKRVAKLFIKLRNTLIRIEKDASWYLSGVKLVALQHDTFYTFKVIDLQLRYIERYKRSIPTPRRQLISVNRNGLLPKKYNIYCKRFGPFK